MSQSSRVEVDASGQSSGLVVGVEYDVVVRSASTAATRLVLTDAAGRPLAGVPVRVWGRGEPESGAQVLESDASGVVTPALASSSLCVRLLARGTARTWLASPAPAAAPAAATTACAHCEVLQRLAGTSAQRCRRGSSDREAVTALQHHLARFGYPLGAFGPNGDGVDGDYGKKTSEALAAFVAEVEFATCVDPDSLDPGEAALVVRQCASGFRSSGAAPQAPPPARVEPGEPGSLVRSSHISVGGRPFVEWFNAVWVPEVKRSSERLRAKTGPLDEGGFRNIFDNIEPLTGKRELPLNEFIAHLFIVYAELGSSLKLQTERGSPVYCFEPGRGDSKKASYNGHPSRAPGAPRSARDMRYAGEQLREWNVISEDADYDAWNSRERYPHQPPAATRALWTDAAWEEVKRRANDCDFYKFRGRGLNQLTWRENYVRHADPFLREHFGKTSDEMTVAELDEAFLDARIYLASFRSFNASKFKEIDMVNRSPPQWEAYSRKVNRTTAAAERFVERCTRLLEAMTAAGYECR